MALENVQFCHFFCKLFFLKNEPADSEVDNSFTLIWYLDFPCVICFSLFFFVEKTIWTSGKSFYGKIYIFFRNFIAFLENYKLNLILMVQYKNQGMEIFSV